MSRFFLAAEKGIETMATIFANGGQIAKATQLQTSESTGIRSEMVLVLCANGSILRRVKVFHDWSESINLPPSQGNYTHYKRFKADAKAKGREYMVEIFYKMYTESKGWTHYTVAPDNVHPATVARRKAYRKTYHKR